MSTFERSITHVLIVVQNLPVPLDRRVWLECRALTDAGYEVSVICPKGPGDPARDVIEGVRIYKYRPAPPATNALGYAWEFAYSWVRTAVLSLAVWGRRPFQILQACNPPDTYWLLARLWRGRGVQFIYDQHDLNPELFHSRFGTPIGLAARLQYKGLLWLERMTYRHAQHVVSTNESYQRVAMSRGGKTRDEVSVVRSGPDTRQMRPIHPSGEAWRGGDFLLVYLGIMGPQDDVDVLLRVMEDLIHQRGRKDVRLALLGFGDCLEALERDAHLRGLDEWVFFTGRVGPSEIAEYLSSADIGLCPDRKTPLNDVSTMNKTMEFMSYGLPSVAFDLVETRVSAADTALFIDDGDLGGFADAIELLLDDPDLRVRLGLEARARVEQVLDWRPQAANYVAAFDRVVGIDRVDAALDLALPTVVSDESRFVNLHDRVGLAAFLRRRDRTEGFRALDVPNERSDAFTVG